MDYLYNSLSKNLENREYFISDLITGQILLLLMNRTEQGWFTYEQQQKISCNGLNRLDELWSNASDGHYGFRAQRAVYLQDNPPDSPSAEIKFQDWTDEQKVFVEKVGWFNNNQFKEYESMSWEGIGSSPVGHLPIGARVCHFSKQSPQTLCLDFRTGLRFSLVMNPCFNDK